MDDDSVPLQQERGRGLKWAIVRTTKNSSWLVEAFSKDISGVCCVEGIKLADRHRDLAKIISE